MIQITIIALIICLLFGIPIALSLIHISTNFTLCFLASSHISSVFLSQTQ